MSALYAFAMISHFRILYTHSITSTIADHNAIPSDLHLQTLEFHHYHFHSELAMTFNRNTEDKRENAAENNKKPKSTPQIKEVKSLREHKFTTGKKT